VDIYQGLLSAFPPARDGVQWGVPPTGSFASACEAGIHGGI
jgi:hypothetical protein